MTRLASLGPTAVAAIAGTVFLCVIVGYGVALEQVTVEELAAGSPRGTAILAVGVCGVFLLGAAPAWLFVRHGYLLPAVAVAAILLRFDFVGADAPGVPLFVALAPIFALGVLAAGGLEYLLRRLLEAGGTVFQLGL